MIPWLIAAGWALGTILVSRWTIGWFIRDALNGRIEEPDEWLLIFLIFLATAIGWPLIIPVILGKLVSKSPVWPAISRWIKWFYTLDREDRKKVLAK